MTRAVLAALAALALAAPAAAASEFPVELPGDVTAAAVRADPDTWLVGGDPGSETGTIARRFGARSLGLGGYELPKARARAFADALKRRGLLVYAQANVYRRMHGIPNDPLSGPPNDWRAKVASPELEPPPVTPQSPLIALVDAAADTTHVEWTGNPNFSSLGGRPVTLSHGTATASIAAAPLNGIGILGVWPGARTLNVPLRTEPADGAITCAASGEAIAQAVAAGASVINMSYGSPSRCVPEWIQIFFAVAKGIIPVAAAGNEFEAGNPLEFPASLAHVVTIAATTANDRSASFSNTSDAIDLSAPGVRILAAVPPALDEDGVKDGWEALDGTSFSAPMVSAALAWVRAARPELTPYRAVQAVRLSARDVLTPGWDSLTGYGVLDVGAALAVSAAKLPVDDPLEPNDNLVWVDGTAFGKPARAVWSGGRAIRLNAQLDKQEDPIDVYRIALPGGRSARITVIPRFGDPRLDVFRASAASVHDTSGRIATSARKGGKHNERVTIRNTGTRKRSFYIAVRPQGSSRYQEREYTLRIG